MSVSRALTIAGSDSGGGAGIQADLKTFQMLDVYGMSAITAITAQNTLGVHGIYPVPLDGIGKQIDAVVTDIGVDAAKTGMLADADIIQLIAEKVQQHRIEKLVVDPVMVAKGGARLLQEQAQDALLTALLPLAYVTTPNIPEAEVLTGREIHTFEDMKDAAKQIADSGVKYVIVKGGHLDGPSIDVLYDGNGFIEFESERFDTRHTHGTGCTFSAAITAELAKNTPIVEAVQIAKQFITAAIRDILGIGQGHGPTNHWAYTRSMKTK